MTKTLTRTIATVAIIAATASSAAASSHLGRAKDLTDRIREADPPQVSTTTKPSPVGQRVDEYKPKGPSVHPKEPPAPPRQADCHPSMGWRTRQALGC